MSDDEANQLDMRVHGRVWRGLDPMTLPGGSCHALSLTIAPLIVAGEPAGQAPP